ncbi:cytochrome ubiquinol oxidase subunit I, partial [Mycobacterium sp.]
DKIRRHAAEVPIPPTAQAAGPLGTHRMEWRGQRTGDLTYRLLARRLGRGLGVLFAFGAVSGTILSFEMGLLWSGLMQHYGSVIGLPFAVEGFAFFIEAIFPGIYLYGWDRLSPRVHLLSGVPIMVAGVLSAFCVVCANAWMNSSRLFARQIFHCNRIIFGETDFRRTTG